MGAAGEQGDGVATEVELAREMTESKLLKEEWNVIKDVKWGLHS